MYIQLATNFKHTLTSLLVLWVVTGSAFAQLLVSDPTDICSVEPDLVVPEMTGADPGPGRRVKQTIPTYRQTEVYHALYLPTDWKPKSRFPVIVEFAGNGPYKNRFGDVSTGRVEGSKLGFGISAGKSFIWICMPYLNNDGTANVTKWWGDKPEYRVGPTIEYCHKSVKWICEHYGGDPEAVILVGFSRGAIACNYVGLHNDEIAKLWRGFVVYSHYDGVIENWGYPGADRVSALERLKRLDNRPQFICHEVTANRPASLDATKAYLEISGIKAPLELVSTGFRNHDDAWILRPSPTRQKLRTWLSKILENNTN